MEPLARLEKNPGPGVSALLRVSIESQKLMGGEKKRYVLAYRNFVILDAFLDLENFKLLRWFEHCK